MNGGDDNVDKISESHRMVEINFCARYEILHSPFGVIGLKQIQIGFPFITNDLTTGEAADGDDHGKRFIRDCLWVFVVVVCKKIKNR